VVRDPRKCNDIKTPSKTRDNAVSASETISSFLSLLSNPKFTMANIKNPRVIMNKYIESEQYPIPGEPVTYDTTEEIDLEPFLKGGA